MSVKPQVKKQNKTEKRLNDCHIVKVTFYLMITWLCIT